MAKFRKKPVVIEAVQYDYHSTVPEGVCMDDCREPNLFGPHIHTLEGLMNVSPKDWVIKGINGEYYPCKPDIFEKTYEPIIEHFEF